MIKPKEQTSNKTYAPISGQAAAKRAVRKVYERAAQEGRKLAVWRNGRVERIDPSVKSS